MSRLPRGAIKIYDRLIEIRAQKGSEGESLFPKEYFRHSFRKDSKAAVYGLPNGDLYVSSQAGKPLHKEFEYSERDYKRNPVKKKKEKKGFGYYHIYSLLTGRSSIIHNTREYIQENYEFDWNEIWGPYKTRAEAKDHSDNDY